MQELGRLSLHRMADELEDPANHEENQGNHPQPGSRGPFVAADLAFARLAADSGAAVAFEHWPAPDAVTFGDRGLSHPRCQEHRARR